MLPKKPVLVGQRRHATIAIAVLSWKCYLGWKLARRSSKLSTLLGDNSMSVAISASRGAKVQRPSHWRYNLRSALAALGVVATLLVSPVVLGWVWDWTYAGELPSAKAIPWGPASQAALESYSGLSTSLFQTALALAAGLWTILLVKKEEAAIVLHDWQERLLVVCATVALGLSIVAYVQFVWQLTDFGLDAAISDHIPDLSNNHVRFRFLSQCACIGVGVGSACAAVLSALWIQPENKSNG